MTTLSNNSEYVAVSYDSPTFDDLKIFLSANGIELKRQEPAEFYKDYNPNHNYINLVFGDMVERKHISKLLDERQLTRFSYIHPTAIVNGNVDPGCFLYPNVVIYANCQIKNDTIIHAQCAIAHWVEVGQGSFFSGGVIVGGSSKLGKFNKYMLGVLIHDKVTICDDVVIGSNAVIRKNIKVPGVYAPVTDKVRRLLKIC